MMLRRCGVLVFGVLLFALAVAMGQEAAGQNPQSGAAATAGNSAAADDSQTPGHGFEVATVKPTDPNVQRQFSGFAPAPLASGRLSVSAMPLEGLVFAAYAGMQMKGRVEGGPKWVDTDLWDLEAKLDDADMAGWDKLSDRERAERMRPAFRALLVERFGLKLHTETKETAVYALVQAKGGVKMKEVDPPEVNMDPQKWEEWMRNQKAADGSIPGMLMVTMDTWKGHALQAGGLAGQIAYAVGATGKPIVDETGLEGHYYDLSFKFTKDKDGLTMEQQIADGLGLRIEERKVPMKVYVIDAAEKPGEN
jgi:uncharacterized protein (TIGR03435 family)